MRSVLPALILILAAALAAPALAADASPDLRGEWTGKAMLHRKNTGFIKAGTPSLVILEQDGPLFHGEKASFEKSTGRVLKETFSGVITPDGRVYIAEEERGMNVGTYRDGLLLLFYLEDGPDHKAVIQEFRKK